MNTSKSAVSAANLPINKTVKAITMIATLMILFFSLAGTGTTMMKASAQALPSPNMQHQNITPMAGAGADPDANNDDGGGISSSADDSFDKVIQFFIKWMARVGLVVALVGGIMFALAIKDNNADQKTLGLYTMVAGFAVAALCQGSNAIFGLGAGF